MALLRYKGLTNRQANHMLKQFNQAYDHSIKNDKYPRPGTRLLLTTAEKVTQSAEQHNKSPHQSKKNLDAIRKKLAKIIDSSSTLLQFMDHSPQLFILLLYTHILQHSGIPKGEQAIENYILKHFAKANIEDLNAEITSYGVKF